VQSLSSRALPTHLFCDLSFYTHRYAPDVGNVITTGSPDRWNRHDRTLVPERLQGRVMDLLIALFSIACVVWLIPVIQSGRLFVIAMLVLVIGTIFGPQFFAIDTVIQFSVDRMLWLAMLCMAVVGWRMGYTSIPRLNRIDWLVCGIAVWFLLSALRGGPLDTRAEPVAQWFFYIMMPISMYAIARLIKINQQDVRWMLAGSIGLGIYLAVTAVCELAGFDAMVFPSFIRDAESWEFYGRGRGPLLNPSGNGFLMSISLVATMVGFLYSGRRGKLLYPVITIVLLCGVYATLTRSAWLAACVSAAVIVLMYTPRWARVLGLAAVVLVGGASIAGFKDQLIRMKRDRHLSAAAAEKSIQLRPLLAIVAWEMFKDHPIVGHGYGQYFEHSGPYHNDASYGLPLKQARPFVQHNVFLSVLVDTGLVGLALYFAWLITLAGVGWRLAREATGMVERRWVGLLLLGTMTAYLGNGMFQDVTIIPMVHMYLFFMAGVAVTAYYQGVAKEAVSHGRALAPAAVTADRRSG
jgi:O-antigen ligase